MKMFLLNYHVTPVKGQEAFEHVGGAYVNCFIQSTTLANAKSIAEREIENGQWEIIELDYAIPITETDFIDDERHQYYEQALIDNEVFVYNTYPKGK